MVEYNKTNVKLSDAQLNKLISSVEYQTGSTLKMDVKMFNGNSLLHELLLTTRKTTKLRNAFQNNISTDVKLSRAQISKIIQSGGFLGSSLSKLAGLLLEVAVPLPKNILVPSRVTAAASVIDAGIQKKIHASRLLSDSASQAATLMILNKEMNDITKLVQAREDSNILLKLVTKKIKNETKEQKEGFLGILLGTLGASLLGYMLTRK